MNLIRPAGEMFVKIVGDPVRGHLNAEANVPPLQAVTMCLQAALVMAQKHAAEAAMIVGVSKGNGDPRTTPPYPHDAPSAAVLAERIGVIFESLDKHYDTTRREIHHINALLAIRPGAAPAQPEERKP